MSRTPGFIRTVLVTGAAGFIGSHLAEACARRGWEVVAIDGFTDYYSPQLKRRNVGEFDPAIDFRRVDLSRGDLTGLLDGVDVVFHLAAQPGVRASWGETFERYTECNVNATQRLLEAARRHAVAKFVLASSSSVYGDALALPTPEISALEPVSPYGVTKVVAEQLAQLYWRSFGVPATVLRLFTVYGPRQRPDMAFNRLIEAALAGAPFEVYGDGRQTRDFTHVSDTVAGLIAAAECAAPGSVFNIGAGEGHALTDAVEIVEAELGGAIDLRFRDRERGDAAHTAADISLARESLGFAPRVSLAEGLRDQFAWQAANSAAGMRVAS